MRTQFVGLVVSVLLASCCSVGNSRFDRPELLPRVHTIGVHPVLAFHEDQDLAIPIDGANLADPSIRWSLHVQGVRQLIEGQDYAFDLVSGPPLKLTSDKPAQKYATTLQRSSVVLTISRRYLKNVQSGDPLRISIALTEGRFQDLQHKLERVLTTSGGERREHAEQAQNHLATIEDTELRGYGQLKDALDNLLATTSCNHPESLKKISSLRKSLRGKQPVLSYSTRKFVLYKAQEYRDQYLKTRIPIGNIHAFPLSSQETVDLFGQLVENMYFVVKLSVDNHKSDDLLINTGMIRAHGTATVGDDRDSWITFPVEIAPQSLQHVYAVVRDTKHERLRERIFRFLDFTGELGTAVSGAWGTTDLVQAFGLYTGVFVPELAKLWTDPVPGHLANLVNFSFPDLVKVPQGATVTHKYLFFSKLDLQAMLPGAAPAYSEWPRANEFFRNLDVELAAYNPDSSRIGYLAFDALDIPFDLVSSPVKTPIEQRMLEAKALLQGAMDTANLVKTTWLDAAESSGTYPYGSNKKLKRTLLKTLGGQTKPLIDALTAQIKAASGDDSTDLKKRALAAITTLQRACNQLAPDKVGTVVAESGIASINQITANLFELNRFLTDIARGISPSRFSEPFKVIESQTGVAHRTYVLYDSLAAIATELAPLAEKMANELKNTKDIKSLDEATTKTFETWASKLVHLAEATTEVAIDAASPAQTLPQPVTKFALTFEARGTIEVAALDGDKKPAVSAIVPGKGENEFNLVGDRGTWWRATITQDASKQKNLKNVDIKKGGNAPQSAESAAFVPSLGKLFVATEKDGDSSTHEVHPFDDTITTQSKAPIKVPFELPVNEGLEALTTLKDGRLLAISEGGDAWYLNPEKRDWGPNADLNVKTDTAGQTINLSVRGAATLPDGSVLILFQDRVESADGDYAASVYHYSFVGGAVTAKGNKIELPGRTDAAYEGIACWHKDGKTFVLLVSDNMEGETQRGLTKLAQFELKNGNADAPAEGAK